MKLSAYDQSDIKEIEQLFTKTFSDSEGESEGLVIGNLVRDIMVTTDTPDLYGFVAIDNEQIIGCIFFSKLTFEGGVKAFLLSPVAIHTDFQRKGMGQKLINFGLNALKDNGTELVFTYGDPDYYSKVGFKPISEKIIKAPFKLSYPLGWLAQSLVSEDIKPITGNSYCVKAFNKPEIW